MQQQRYVQVLTINNKVKTCLSNSRFLKKFAHHGSLKFDIEIVWHRRGRWLTSDSRQTATMKNQWHFSRDFLCYPCTRRCHCVSSKGWELWIWNFFHCVDIIMRDGHTQFSWDNSDVADFWIDYIRCQKFCLFWCPFIKLLRDQFTYF